MVMPLQIEFVHDTVRLTAAAVPYGTSMQRPLEFGFIVEDGDTILVLTPEEFACHDASCRPPTSGGTGGSIGHGEGAFAPGARFAGGGPGTLGGDHARTIGAAQHEEDMKQLMSDAEKPFKNNHVNADGTLGLPFTEPGGAGTVKFDPAMQKWVDEKLHALGVTHEELVNNLVHDAQGAIEMPGAAKAIKWYDTEHEWGAGLSKEYGVSLDRVFAAVSLTSAMRKWGNEGVGTNPSSTNKGAIETILKKLKEDKPFEVTQEMADKFNNFKGQKKGIGVGAEIKPGIYKPSDLSSVSMARLATDLGWKILNSAGAKPVAKAIAVIRGELAVNDVVRGTKQRSFVSNLVHPEIDYTSTNDLWHFRAVAGNTKFNFPDRRKNEDGTKVTEGSGNQVKATLKEYESHTTGYDAKGKPVRGNAPHDIFTGSPPNSGLYTEVTKITRDALDRLATKDARFKGMKVHEFQALVWKYAGGNSGGSEE